MCRFPSANGNIYLILATVQHQTTLSAANCLSNLPAVGSELEKPPEMGPDIIKRQILPTTMRRPT